MEKTKNLKISDREMNCFLMLWRWKLLSTHALCVAIYKDRSLYRAYCKLLDLEKNGFIKSIGSWDQNTIVWQLDQKGYEIIASRFEIKIHAGFRSEAKDHDFWVSAIHIGEWINGIPKNCELYSEQQLRKIECSDYPDWVPQTKLHRPDGWWKISNGNGVAQLIALEVELSKKTKHAYNEIGDFYSNTVNPYQVIWVVKSKADLNYIFSHLKEGSSSEAQEHSFIFLDQYIQSQWKCKIITGKNAGKTLSEILRTSSEPAANQSLAQVLVDVRKKPVKSKSPRLANRADLGLSN